MIETGEGTDKGIDSFAVGIRFKRCGKIYTFQTGESELAQGTQVVVESDLGLSIGTVVIPPHSIEGDRDKLKKVKRIANERDFATMEKNRSLAEEARAFCVEKARELNLSMKVVATETTLDRKRLIFYFTADGRIDFRELVRDLASQFKTRIEMRQIGVRDEVKLLGGIGACGRQTCCNLFLTAFEPVTIRMAKRQELSINQSKLSGICGRLMCCLGYEYRDAQADRRERGVPAKEMPAESEKGAERAPRESEADSPAVGEDRERAVPASGNVREQRETKDAQPATARRERRGRFRRRSRGKQKKRPAEASAPETASQESKTETEGSESKGRPFSRRKKFWKKKKR